MSASRIEYEYVEDVEALSDYRPGGYHPIRIEDVLHERYRVIHKLGHGAFSTAWLALDSQTSTYVAIKVGTADADGREVDILSQLTTGVAATSDGFSHAGGKAAMIPLVLDRFTLEGPNGTHPCFVTLPARCSLMDAKEASDPRLFQLDVARSLAAQLAIAVSIVHSHGYAHGDLHLGNLLLQLPSSLNNVSADQFYAEFGAPEPEAIVRLDGKPTSSAAGVPPYAIPPVWLGKASDEIALNEAKLLLVDFGVAFRPSEKSRFESYTPLVIRPPEAFFEPKTPLSLASDIWSLGCTVFELLAHRSLIDGILAPQDEITAQQVHLQGPLPSEWWSSWEERSKWFDEAGRPLSNERDIWTWDRRFEQWVQEPRQSCGMDVIDDEEKAALFEMLRRMLAWRPSERPTAEEVLDMAWMKTWALPAHEKCQNAWE
ncbi:Serine/threonine-protein kinase SRPK [Colletotrichum shisoi]|uniref:non-specific serine/threonine protein kinase n=1 Tax=Colletotrichum shisoi TaxID=2078593 RepID=A0A5Q4BQC3_9PEZI|nr:Serine/threonine-protein kinase SRPK [Colletotrichum shisoi]